jgi:hypothetical protein
MVELLLAVGCGLIGGLARAVQSGRRVIPGRGADENGEVSRRPGFLGTIFIGAVAGLAAWLFNASPADPGIDLRPLGWALVAGFAGDIVFDYYINQNCGAPTRQERQDTGGVIDEVSATANTASREAERAHEERRELQQRVAELEGKVDELQAENERLRKGGTLDN